jgi:DHA2 family multidrug resistance protein
VVGRQAEIIAYMDDYVLLICTTLPALLLLLVMRKPKHGTAIEVEVSE